ncbi:MAG: reverse transcriptase domain-containing protein [Hafnia sp.]
MALQITDRLPVQTACTHVKGHHGGRDSLAAIAQAIRGGARYVYRTDIRGYYRHIQKVQLYHHLCRFVPEPALQSLLHQYLYYSVEDGGEIHTPLHGISRGCALSPLVGASFLWFVDIEFSGRRDIRYVRYMDDFLFLSDRRWPVRRAQKQLYTFFNLTGFECHPDKTQHGKISQGFDWLGVWFTDNGATGIAPRANENHRLRRLRLIEQSRRAGLTEPEINERVQLYDRRWLTWAESMLSAAGLNKTI